MVLCTPLTLRTHHSPSVPLRQLGLCQSTEGELLVIFEDTESELSVILAQQTFGYIIHVT